MSVLRLAPAPLKEGGREQNAVVVVGVADVLRASRWSSAVNPWSGAGAQIKSLEHEGYRLPGFLLQLRPIGPLLIDGDGRAFGIEVNKRIPATAQCLEPRICASLGQQLLRVGGEARQLRLAQSGIDYGHGQNDHRRPRAGTKHSLDFGGQGAGLFTEKKTAFATNLLFHRLEPSASFFPDFKRGMFEMVHAR